MALRNGHSFLGSDGQEHAIKMVGRNNRIIGRTERGITTTTKEADAHLQEQRLP
jgi:hypothetical protein